MRSPSDILKEYWGYDSFRPLQEEIISSILNGKDTLALLPTGGGKSICFQVPAMMKEGLCLVISPLIALMKDQVQNLRKKNITAFAIYSGMSRREVVSTLRVASESNCKFLYVSPERLETNLFKEYLPALNIDLIAVDEAHCISQWGYDFRPPYLRIAALRAGLPNVPVLALTASATSLVQRDICEKLEFREPVIFRQSFLRKNLSFSVFRVSSKINKIIEILQKVPGSAIVYCGSRKRTRELSNLIVMHGISSDFYHAGLTSEERSQKQDEWMKNSTRVIVCTNAFGMGIDKPDVRVVIHADSPDCLENYYQEAGRAGRDEKKSYAVLLFSEQELEEMKLLPDIHFPNLQQIREVYQALTNYLQIPTGTEGVYYNFDIADFIKKFKLDTILVTYALKALQQEEILSFNEQVFVPSTVAFSTNKEMLYTFEKDHGLLEPLIKVLLRTYSGIFDQAVAIHERTIANLLRKPVEETIHDLRQLHGYGIIQYAPQKDSPQLLIIKPRLKAEELQINQINYKKRKEQYQRRIDAMIQYIGGIDCRSTAIANYFGEENPEDCGVCDNCLQKKSQALNQEEFRNIRQRIIQVVDSQPVPATELLQRLPGIHKQKLKQVIDYLQSENKLLVDKDGFVKML